MEKLTFKNMFVNIVIGGILIILALLGYFLDWVEDFLPIFIGVIIVLLSVKRFIISYKIINSKNGSKILIIELALDFLFAGLLIYLRNNVDLFIGLATYSRGVSYLLINYIVTRKINITQYLINILYVTLGAFFMFYPLNSLTVLEVGVSLLFLIIGGIYLFYGISALAKKEKKVKKVKAIEKKAEEIEEKNDEDSELQEQIETKETTPEEVTESQVDYESKTLAELKVIAKEKDLQGFSKLNKASLIKELEKL